MDGPLEIEQDGMGPPGWAAFGDLMAGVLGTFVLVLADARITLVEGLAPAYLQRQLLQMDTLAALAALPQPAEGHSRPRPAARQR